MDLMAIINACFNLFTGILNAVLYFLIPRPVITDDQANRRDSHLATQFIQKFEEKYGDVHPDFFHGTLSEALERAKRDLRFAMVILQTVWAGDIKDPEAYQATTFPFVAVIVAQIPQGSAGSSPRLFVVDRFEGYSSPENLIARLTLSIDRNGPSLQRIRNERAEHEAAREIRAQQDDAYLASLRADQEKERKARELVEAQRLAEERARKEKEARQLLALNRENWRRWTLKNLPDEPRPEETEVAKLSFRLANGERVVRKFRATDTVETVYNFVDTYNLRDKSSSSNVSEPSADYTHTFNFLLVSPYPRTVHHADKFKEIQNEQGLWPSANLIVEELTSDDDEEI
ncbi:539_t:CDS:2 [Funneliformis caledonium]|uniref:539_t:CDS:1 n=1 Tax=Funneliformis caledonium TaxID=1117310 RepID=A0A9N9AQ39_9GLOM|nr:539_t:CDS:2 [Funneliformis caledonium]